MRIHVGQLGKAAVCLEVFGQKMRDQIVPGCALKLELTCLNLNAPYLLVEPLAPNRASSAAAEQEDDDDDYGKVEQRAKASEGREPAVFMDPVISR